MFSAAKRPGGTFANVGATFNPNSTNRKDTGVRPEPGKGDLNEVHDIVGIPDFKSSRWAEAGSLKDVSSAGSFWFVGVDGFRNCREFLDGLGLLTAIRARNPA